MAARLHLTDAAQHPWVQPTNRGNCFSDGAVG